MKKIMGNSKVLVILMLAMAMTLAMMKSTYADSYKTKFGLKSNYTIQGSSLSQINRRGRINLKRVIQRRLLERLHKNAKLESVSVWAKAVGPENNLDLEVGNWVVDDTTVLWEAPVCKVVDVKKVITRRDGTTREVVRPERVCSKPIPQLRKVTLYNYDGENNKAWVVNSDIDLDITKIEVKTTVPISYETQRISLGRKTADKLVSSSKNFKLTGTNIESIVVKASKQSINLTGVKVYFSDGTSYDVPNVNLKVSKKSKGVSVEIGKPFKRATSVTVSAMSRSIFGSRGKMHVSVDYITSGLD